MVFNWFRRQFNKEEAEEQDTPPEAEAEQDAPGEVSDDAGETSEAEDYRSWAETAFQKIQERQQETTAETVAPEVEAKSSSADEVIASPDVEAESSVVAEVTPEVGSEPAPEATPTTAEIEEIDAVTPEVASSPEPIAATPAPVAKTESPSPTSPPAQPSPSDLQFDEGFLWSAEVLAAQGRRPEEVSVEEISWLQKLRQGLGKTRRGLANQLKSVVGQGPLNADAVMEIESLLLQADVGISATDKLIEALQTKVREETLPPDAAIAYLKEIMQNILDAPTQKNYSPNFAPKREGMNIWLMTGVNGAGKTTTIGKLAHISKESGYACLIAAADTFRAAAVEQVKVWGQRSNVDVIANPGQNTDPAAVVFDAITAAQKRNIDLLLVDTAGRLQNKKNLMDELNKVRRIVSKKAPDAHIESLLVLDATLGQNGLRQAQVFSEAAELTGVVLTKLDGSAKGGVALAVVQELGLPIRFIGAGEGITDLRPFSSYEFVEALLST
ncbi:signal recognition particle-docking protein FtsY [Acaryochloris sp. CCMEE 5410]|uniref:signal recognition particle-docking protein FtsY n=1 Tax=Acaryochloris sp. CCMEE 5410 TaxID=310037 RepID=UPI0002483EB0|nr:signal recognition particle-docking protein FtsY [Acaryochloris sp. CCMEE 5410]KAI9133907.1 signal recognition particle-docking protein FtsY [Acaryochloris sp. CCMEE 5410]